MTIKLAVCSDLHADTTPANGLIPHLVAEYVAGLSVDALIVVGDLSARIDRFEIGLRELKHAGCPVGFVAGNHDIWQLPEDTRPWEDSWDKLDWIVETCNTEGIQFLGEWVLNDEVLVMGTLGWYDYSFAKPELADVLEPHAYEEKYLPGVNWLDSDYAKWGAPDADVAASFNKSLAERLDENCQFLPPDHRATVVATHMVPFLEGVTYKGELNWDFTCAFMGNRELGEVILQHAIGANITHVVFGHTHLPTKFAIGGIKCTCAPFGFFPKLDPDEDVMREIVARTVQVIEV